MLNINEIVQGELNKMQESGAIETAISESINKTILRCVTEKFTDYDLRKVINENLEKNINSCISQIDFSSYNGLIINIFKSLIDNQLKADIVEKAEAYIKNMLFVKRETILFSELCDAYLKHIHDASDYSGYLETYNKYKLTLKESDNRGMSSKYFTIDLFLKGISYNEEEVYIGIKQVNEGEELELAEIYHITYGNRSLQQISLGNKSDFEIFLINLLMNNTKIVFDIHEDDVSTSLHDW